MLEKGVFHMMARFYLFILAFTFSACVSPTARAPSVLQQELTQEAAQQRAFLREKSAEPFTPSGKITPEMEQRLEKIGSRIAEGGVAMCPHIAANNKRCHFTFHLKAGKEVNAYADGNRIIVTPAMMEFAQTDEELATILGHEYAHNLMAHVDAQKQNTTAGWLIGTTIDFLASAGGVPTGSIFSDVGGKVGALTYSKDFENEADYIGLYIMARAGYDISQSAHIWRRFSLKDGEKSIYTGTTHPTNSHRFIALTKAIAEIESKQKSGMPLLPEFRPKEETSSFLQLR
jgi:predicted Zn-dependent protease